MASHFSSIILTLPGLLVEHVLPYLNLKEELTLANLNTDLHRLICPEVKVSNESDLDGTTSSSFSLRLHAANTIRRHLQARVGQITPYKFVPSAKAPTPATDSSSSASTITSVDQYEYWSSGRVGWRMSPFAPIEQDKQPFVFSPTSVTLLNIVQSPKGQSGSCTPIHVLTTTEVAQSLIESAPSTNHTTELNIDHKLTQIDEDRSNCLGGFSLPSLSGWNCTELRQFLVAWESLCSIARRLSEERAQFTMCNRGNFLSSEDAAALRTPLPFILPWPKEYGKGDHRSRQAPPRQHHPIHAWDLLIWDAGADTSDFGPCPYDRQQDPSQLSGFDVDELSSVVRGCPWPLDVIEDVWQRGFNARIRAEQFICTNRIGALLGFNAYAHDDVIQYGDACAGRRSISYVDARTISRELSDSNNDVEPRRGPHLNNWFNASGEALSTATLHELSTLLLSSFTIGIGTEHHQPFPHLLVAPLAPGWLGGFMCGGTGEAVI